MTHQHNHLTRRKRRGDLIGPILEPGQRERSYRQLDGTILVETEPKDSEEPHGRRRGYIFGKGRDTDYDPR